MGRSNVFSLEQIYRKQVTQTWSKIPEVFRYVNSIGGSSPIGTDYGYFGGGSAPGVGGPYSTVDRLDFSNDTDNMVTKGPLSRSASSGAATGNTSYGYAAGGGWPIGSTVDRVDYSSDTGTASVKGPLETNTGGMGPVTNNTYGYFASGRAPSEGAGWTTEIQRIEYASDTSTSVVKGTVAWPAGGQGVAGTGNMNYGYFGGGRIYPGPGYLSVSFVGRIDYTNDTQTAPSKGPLTQIRGFLGAAGNADYGYFGGGQDQNGSSYMSIVDRVDYSNDTATASPKGNLADGKHYISATGNTSYGYWAGGYGNTTKCQRVDFSNDTATASLKGNLSQFNTNQYAFSSRECNLPTTLSTNTVPATRTESGAPSPVGTDYGYFAGGYGGSPVSTIDRVDFSNDTASASARSPLAAATYEVGAVSSQSYGYFTPGGPSKKSWIYRLDYSSDSTALSPKGPLTDTSGARTTVGNINYGWFNRGYGPSDTKLQRIDYSSDTATALERGSTTEQGVGATGNQSYGWFGGGSPSRSTVERMDFSNDTAAAAPKGPLNNTRSFFDATGNADYGYFVGGGQTPISRVDFGNDTATASPKGSTVSNTDGTAATGNTSYGYVAPGGPGNGRSLIQRIDYSNDTAAAADKGNQTVTRRAVVGGGTSPRESAMPTTTTPSVTVDKGADGYTVAGSAPSYGYTAGGYMPGHSGGTYSSIRRIDFSNDSSVVNKGNLESVAQRIAAIASPAYGYIAGGWPSRGTVVSRLDLASDTTTTTPKGNLATTTDKSAGVGTKDYGYIGGGNEPAGYTLTQRIDYSNDTATTSPKGYLTVGRALLGATGNTSYGYFTAGWSQGASPSPRQSTVDRLDYSSDTTNTSPKGHLSAVKYGVGSTGNASYGYVGGGNPGPLSHVDRIDYGNDTATALAKGPLAAAMRYMSSTGNQSYGYWLEGHPGPISTINRIDYSNDTASPSPGNGPNLHYAAGFSAAANALAGPESFIPRIRWVDGVAETPSTIPNTAYVGGGTISPSITSTIERIDYSNDTATASTKGLLTVATKNSGAYSSSSGGYFTGGQNPGAGGTFSKTDRLDYSNDTATATLKGNLPEIKYAIGGINNSTYGWAVGGNPNYGTVYRLEFASDTTALSTRAAMSPNGASYFPAGTGNENYGYMAAGVNSGGTTGGETPVDRIDYANDTSTPAPKGKIRAGAGTYRYALNAGGNNDYGYFYGGDPGYVSKVDRLDFSNDTATAEQKANLPEGSMAGAAAANSTNAYLMGGIAPGHSHRSTVTRIDFSNDTSAPSPKGPLTATRAYGGGASARSNAQYQFGESILAPVQPPFPYPEQLPAPAPGHGYWSGGLNNTSPSNPATSEIGRIDFSNDTATTVLKGNMYIGRSNHSVIGNSTYAYTGGGAANPSEASPAYLSSIERMTYANDTATSVDKSTFREAFTQVPSPGQGANMAVAVGNQSYGYWGGQSGYVDRLDYSNDTAQAAAKTSQTVTKNGRAALGNLSYGYMCGGWISVSTIDRIDYGNDTATMSPKGNLSTALAQTFGIGNSNYGYIITGRSPSLPTYRTSVERVDYANDTDTASPKGPLAGTTYKGGGTGDASYGYVVKGQEGTPFGYHSTIFRIDYSNDTATAPSISNFSHPGRSMRGFSGKAYGLPN